MSLFFQIFTVLACASVGAGHSISFGEDQESERVIERRERLVTDLYYIQTGVHVDFSYNQTRSSDDGEEDEISAPGCPKSLNGRPWVYYGSPRKCYLAGFRGPCSFGKILFNVENSEYGLCNCDCFAQKYPELLTDYSRSRSSVPNDIASNSIHPEETHRVDQILYYSSRKSPIRLSSVSASRTRKGALVVDSENLETNNYNRMGSRNSEQYKFCFSPSLHRQVAYDMESKECYPFLEQGPCEKDEWLIKDLERGGVTCEKRKCAEFNAYSHPDSGGGFTYFDYKRQECLTEVFGSLRETFFTHSSGLVSRSSFCRDAGMKYSSRLKTCIKDLSSNFDFTVIG